MRIFLEGDVVKVLRPTPAYGVGHWSDTTLPIGTVASVVRADALMDEYEIKAKNATAVLTGQWLEYVCGQLDGQPSTGTGS